MKYEMKGEMGEKKPMGERMEKSEKRTVDNKGGLKKVTMEGSGRKCYPALERFNSLMY